jgi:hypothetical protein
MIFAFGKQESKNAVLVGRSFVMKIKPSLTQSGVPESFLNKFGKHITAILCGFDRIRFRATQRLLFQPNSMESYLATCGVLIKQFKSFAEGITERVKTAAYEAAAAAGRPVQYLGGAGQDKETLAREMARQEGIREGLIAVFTAVEPCWSYSVRGDRMSKKIQLVLETRKCLHLYHYFQHRDFGLMHVRVQSWFPFTVDVCLNGREWLARQMDTAGLAYVQRDNCFTWVEDPAKVQGLLAEQLHTNWAEMLNALLKQAHPLHEEIGRPFHQAYYWSASQTEYATDVLFEEAATLARWYRPFLHHGMSTFKSIDVLRFLGHYVPASGRIPKRFRGEVTSSLKERPEGVRLRHTVNGNSIKVYNKQGSVLRVETTIVHPEHFKVYRPAEGDPEERLRWQKLRRGIADLWRRGEVSQGSNRRYLEALASVTGKTPLRDEAVIVCRPVKVEGRSYRALNPWAPADGALLEAVSRGEFMVQGFRNRDLRGLLYPRKATPEEDRRRAGRVTRLLALLRAHGLICKISGTHRYQISERGRRIITALLSARNADVDQLTQLAA